MTPRQKLDRVGAVIDFIFVQEEHSILRRVMQFLMVVDDVR